MDLQLPDFENQEVKKTRLKINGIGGDLTRALHIGDKVAMLIELEIEKVEHENAKGGLSRLHRAKIVRAKEVDAVTTQIELDKAQGIEQLFKADGAPNIDDLDVSSDVDDFEDAVEN